MHEQSRPDRDNYVKILWENVDEQFLSEFTKYELGIDTYKTPYDYFSIMHYDSNAFSKNGQPTMVPLVPGVTLVDTAFRKSLSEFDVEIIRKYYECF